MFDSVRPEGSIQPAHPATEDAHPGAPLEWWFVQGWFTCGTQMRYFMIAFFQQRPVGQPQESPPGHMLLLSHFDPQSGGHVFRSQISSRCVELLLSERGNIVADNFDPGMIDDLLEELRRFGPPDPIVMRPDGALLDSGSFSYRWGDDGLSQAGGQLELRYRSPEENLACRFFLTPLRKRVFHDLEMGPDRTMAYAAVPRLSLSGTMGEHTVEGQAWFEHQWGGYSWLTGEGRRRQIFGWNWCGIHFEDGTDLMIGMHLEMQECAVIGRTAIYFEEGGGAQPFTDFGATATRFWESPRTLSRYPVAWRVTLPSIETWVEIEALADDQEIAVFGLTRAVWQGACSVTGSKKGVSVSGKARLELHGYGYLFDYRSYLERWGARIDRQIRAFLPPALDGASIGGFLAGADPAVTAAHTRMLCEPVWDMLRRGGKRWRPVFGYLLLEALGRSYLPFEKLLAVTVELGHLGSLMIDDIEDGSLLRRGEQAVHLRYGTDLTINSGNMLYFLPLLLLEGHPDLNIVQRERIYRIVIRQLVRTHFGQALDIYWSKFVSAENLDRWLDDAFPEKILSMYADKTAAPVVGLARTACVIAEGGAAVEAACVEFAQAFGIAFQIMDDVYNFTPETRKNKVVGEDLAAGKLTYLIVKTFNSARGEQRTLLRRLLCDAALRQDPDQLHRGVEIVQNSEIMDRCRQEALGMLRGPWQKLSEHLRPSEAKTMLRLLCAHLTDLSFVS